MKYVMTFSDYLIPMVIMMILIHGMVKKVDVFDAFIEGTKDGLKVVLEILPTIIGLMLGVGILRTSGFLDFLTEMLTPLAALLHFPVALIPISFMKMISSSASTGLLLDLFKTYGPDSSIGRTASIIVGCTETVFYTLSVYFTVAKVQKIRYTLWGALLVTIAGIIASVIISNIFFP